jgi:hypothetical protein
MPSATALEVQSMQPMSRFCQNTSTQTHSIQPARINTIDRIIFDISIEVRIILSVICGGEGGGLGIVIAMMHRILLN